MLELFLQNNIYSIIVAIFSFGGAYFVIQYKLGTTEISILAIKKRISELEAKQNEIGKIQTNLEWLIKAVEDIKKKLNIL